MKLKWILAAVVAVIAGGLVTVYAVLSSLDFEQYRGTIEDLAKQATGRELTIAGPIDVKISLTPAVTAEDVTFGNAPWGSRPEMVKLKRFELESALIPLLSGEVEVKRLVLVEPDILIESDAEGRSNLDFEGGAGTATEPSDAKSAQVLDRVRVIDEVLLQGARVQIRDGVSGATHSVDLDSLDLQKNVDVDAVKVAAAGRYNGVDFQVDGATAPLRRLWSGPFALKLTTRVAGAAVTLDGVIAQPMTGQGIDLAVDAEGAQLADLGAVTATEIPDLGGYDLSLRLTQEGDAYKLSDIAAKLGDSDLSGEATLSLAGARPALTGGFVSRQLDLRPFIAEGSGGGEGSALFSDAPLPFDLLGIADAELTYRAEKVRLRGQVEASNLDLRITLDEGRLDLDPVSAELWGGRLEAQLNLEAAQPSPTTTATVKLVNLDYGRLLRESGIEEQVTGTLDGDLRLTGRGRSMRAIAASLTGHSEILSKEGILDSDSLNLMATGLNDVLGPLFGGDRAIRLNCMVSRFGFVDGIGSSEALVVDTSAFTLSGGGIVNLKNETLSLTFDTASRQANLASLAVPFDVAGPITSPSVTPDTMGTAVGIAKAAGVWINPVVGLAVLIGNRVAGDLAADKNPCVAALEQAAQAKASGKESGGLTKGAKDAAEGAAGAVGDAFEGLTEGVKSLFGD